MNNREWLNGLSDEEFVEWKNKQCDDIFSDYPELPCANDLSRCQSCKHLIKWLNEPHGTTGHEDLVNAGWELGISPGEDVLYRNATKSQKVLIGKTNTWYDTSLLFFTDTEIDFLRKCADKIRNEKGWV